jgi:phosphopantothenoylcysteine decarboxylase / phosphopantothenate---cysteine ligase
MRILITVGSTREPIDPVRYISNRSSGRMGFALAEAALRAGHSVTLVVGAVTVPVPPNIPLVNAETAAQMHQTLLRLWPEHDLLIMAAAVADFRPIQVSETKMIRKGRLTIECEATEDVVAAVAATRRPDQRIVGFSLESSGDVNRARAKLNRKKLDLMVYNPVQTMDSPDVTATLLWPDGRNLPVPCRSKPLFADILIEQAQLLFA